MRSTLKRLPRTMFMLRLRRRINAAQMSGAAAKRDPATSLPAAQGETDTQAGASCADSSQESA